MTSNQVLALLAVSAIGLAACGTGGDAESPSATPSTVSAVDTSSSSDDTNGTSGTSPASVPSPRPSESPAGPATSEPGASATPTESVAAPFLTELRRCAVEGTGVVGNVTFDSVEIWVGGTDATIDGHLVDVVAAVDATAAPATSQGVTRVDLVVEVDDLVAGSATEPGDRIRIAMEVGCPDFAAGARRLLPDGGINVIAQVQDTGRYHDSPGAGTFVAPNHQAVLFVEAGGALVALDGRPTQREADTRDELLAQLRRAADTTG